VSGYKAEPKVWFEVELKVFAAVLNEECNKYFMSDVKIIFGILLF
jgi:hypothetical protein